MSKPNAKILVVEDNSVLADVIRLNLERSGYQVVLAADGERAIAILRRMKFDLMITDYQLPGMNGEQICLLARHELKLDSMPILMCTAKGFEIDLEHVRSQLGVEHVIFKPFSMREITRLASEVLASSTAAAEVHSQPC